MFKKKVKIPLYPGHLIIIKADNLQPIVDKYGFNVDASKYGAFTFSKHKNGVFRCYVLFTDDFHASLIAHEAVHVVNFIYESIGAKLDIINDEPQAYLTQWAFKKIHKNLKNKRNGSI